MRRFHTFAICGTLALIIAMVTGYLGILHRHDGRHEQTWEQLMDAAESAQKSGAFDEAERLCSEAMRMAREFGPTDTRLSISQVQMAMIYWGQKKSDLAEQSLKDAVASCEKAVGPNHPDMVTPLENMAGFYHFGRAQYDRAAPVYRRILDIVEAAPNHSDREVALYAHNLASVYQLLGQYAQAEPLYKEVLALAEKDNNDVPNFLLTVADFYRAWGKCEQAEPLAKRALAIREKAVGPDAGAHPQIEVAVCLDGLAEIYLTWGKPDQAEPLYSRSLAIIEKVAGADSPDMVPRLTGLAAALRGQGKYEQAETQYKRALKLVEQYLGPAVPEMTAIVEKYATLLDEMNRPEEAKTLRQGQKWKELMYTSARVLKSNIGEAEQLCGEAMGMAREFGPTDTRLSISQVQMAEIYRRQEKYDLAEQSFVDAVASCEKAVGPNHPDMVTPLESLANFYYFTRVQYDRVATLYQWILDIVEGAPDRNDNEVARRAINLADVYQLLGQYAEAESLYKQALALPEKNDDMATYCLLTAADFYRARGKCEQAEPLAKRALAIREKAVGPDTGSHPQIEVAVCLDGLAEIYLTWGKPDLAESLYSRSLAIIEKVVGADNLDMAPRLTGLAAALRGQGKYEQAETQYKRALTVTEKGLGPNAPKVAAILEKYATLLDDMNRPEEAKAHLNRARAIGTQEKIN